MDNTENQNTPQSVPQPPLENNAPPAPEVTPAPNVSPLGPTVVGRPPKSRKKLVYLLILVVIAGIAATSYLILAKKTAPTTPAPAASSSSLSSAKKQYFLKDSVAGYITYKPAAFKEVTATKLPTIPKADPAVNVVIVQANIVGFSDSGLYLYDLKANKTYRLTDGGGSPRIMSDHYLLYAFDTGSGADKRLGGKLLDLQTGQTQTVFSDTPEKVPGTICCSVSPDGFKAAFVQKTKIGVWDIRTQKTTDYTATVDPIDPNFSRTSTNDYNTEMSYAAPAWLDNNTLVYADKPASSQVDANKPAQIVDNTLYQLNISDGKSTLVNTDKSGIYDIYIAGDSIFINEELPDQTYTQISIISKGAAARPVGINPGWAMVSPAGDKVYFFSTLDSANGYSSISTSATGSLAASFDPHITGITVSQILPRGWIDGDRMLLAELDTAGAQNHEYIAIYNTSTSEIEQYLKVN